MKRSKSFFKMPSPADTIGLPPGKYLIHKFPADMKTGESLRVTLNGVKKRLINFDEDNVKPNKQPKQPEKNTRHTEITLKFSYKFKAIKLFLDMASQIIFVFGKRDSPIDLRPEILKPSEAQIITYYKKKTKKKILNACYFGAGHPVADMHRAMANCDVLIAADTNYKEVPRKGIVAATTAIEATLNVVTDEACHLKSGPMRQIIEVDPPGNPELFGIGKVMYHFCETNPNLKDKSIGIITDTDFELIKGINRRTIPFFETMFLPKNVTLFYATSDSGSAEFMANMLIRKCDKASTEHLNNYLATIEE